MSSSPLKIALAGNPNAGKTSVFNAMTGARQHVGNYPGVTVEYKEGAARIDGQDLQIVDLPGTYSLTAYSPEELVARNYIIEQRPDVVVDVVDAANLERNLYLAIQLLELGVPLVLCLNMVDVAEQRGMRIEVEELSRVLGVPVIPAVARAGQGIKDVMRAAAERAARGDGWKPLQISYGSDVEAGLAELTTLIETAEAGGVPGARWRALKCLEGDTEVLAGLRGDPETYERVRTVREKVEQHTRVTLDDEPESIIADHRYGFISGVSHKVLHHEREVRMDFTDKVDRILTNRLLGPAFLLGVLYGIYQFVFWASEFPVALLEGLFGWLGGVVEAGMADGVLRSLLISGVIDGVGGVLGFVPLILFMFFAIAIMEDSGYMARVAYLMDRLLRAFGLHGNSVMSLIVGGGISGGCAVPAVLATRTLKDPKARLATILVVPFMNCGAKLPVYAVLIAAFFPQGQARMMFTLTLISWGLALLAARLLRSTVLRGEQAPFVMELPPYRTPTVKGLLIHTWERSWQYVKKAGTVILGISVLLWAAMTFPGLPEIRQLEWAAKIESAVGAEEKADVASAMAQDALGHTVAGRLGAALTTVTAPLGFDWRTNVALVGGFAAKEVIVSTLGTAYSLGDVDVDESEGLAERLSREPGWSPLKAFALMLFVMVYAPCVVTVAVTRKEAGSWGWALFSVVYTTTIAYVVALIVYQGGTLLGIG